MSVTEQVCGRVPVDAIDDEDRHGPTSRFQFQPKLTAEAPGQRPQQRAN